MKLRRIELTNVRRFAGTRATLDGIGDGLTVLAQPNEFGKSTFFDALHALFFDRHRSTSAAVKALQPHSAGAPMVAVDIDLPEGRFRLSKRWLTKPQARVADAAGRLIAQEDEAEAWIDRLVAGDLAGPSGLLWVRQGMLGVEPEGPGTEARRARDSGLAARRDLLSSVAGEIDLMTGGRRMDAILQRVTQMLDAQATGKGKPKAQGNWALALDEAAALAAEQARLQARAATLAGDLARRTDVQRRLARLTDPQDAAARDAALAAAEVAHQAALAHQARIDTAEAALRLAVLDAEAVARDAAQLQALQDRLGQAREAASRAEARAAAALARAEALRAGDQAAAQAADAATRVARDLQARLAQATAAREALAARSQALDLQRRYDRAVQLQGALDRDRANRAQIRVTTRTLAAAEAAQAALDLARARAEAQAVTIEALPDGAAAIRDGLPFPAGPQPVLAPTDLVLPGFGKLRVDPGPARTADHGAEASQAGLALDRSLAQCAAPDLPAARKQLAEAQRLDAAIAQGVALLAELVPEGTETLRTALAAVEAQAAQAPAEPDNTDAPTLAPTAAELAAADQAEAESRAAARAAHARAVAAGEDRAEAEGERRTAARRLEEAVAEAGDPATLAAQQAHLFDRQNSCAAAVTAAQKACDALRALAPDLETTAARLTRARGAVEQARTEAATLREDLARLNATIATLADEGLEERLSELAGLRTEAEARAARYDADVRALTRLRAALDTARSKARDAYLGPVLRELQPLLAILHPGAHLAMDDKSLLPVTLTRDGQAEPLDILSGGTREQLAILTRLAFARLYAQAGRPVPVILDDALVHSDDDRIEAMFTALHRVARDQQVLVLTCRQRAFAALGGTPAEVRIEPV